MGRKVTSMMTPTVASAMFAGLLSVIATLTVLVRPQGADPPHVVDHVAVGAGPVQCLAVAPNGHVVALVAGPGRPRVRFWNLATRKWLSSIVVPCAFDGDQINALAFSPNGTMLAGACMSGDVVVWHIPKGDVVCHLRTVYPPLACVLSWSPSSEMLAFPTRKGIGISIWNVRSGKKVKTIGAEDMETGWLSWHPSGRMLASVGRDKELRLWAVNDGRMVRHRRLGDKPLTCVAFDGSGARVAVAHDDGVTILDTNSMSVLGSIDDDRVAFLQVEFSSDSRWVAVGGGPNALPEDVAVLVCDTRRYVVHNSIPSQYSWPRFAFAGGQLLVEAGKPPSVTVYGMPDH